MQVIPPSVRRWHGARAALTNVLPERIAHEPPLEKLKNPLSNSRSLRPPALPSNASFAHNHGKTFVGTHGIWVFKSYFRVEAKEFEVSINDFDTVNLKK